MIKTTVGAILAEEVDAGNDERIYIIRDNDLPIYIGQAMYVCERITDHSGLGPRIFQPDQLGNFILNNQPDSLRWHVDLLTLDECELTARLYFPSYSSFDIDIIEQTLIIAFGPCLNIFHNQNNPNRKPIPNKYQDCDISKQSKNWNKDDFLANRNDSQVEAIKSNIDHTLGHKPVNKNAFIEYRQRLSPNTIRSLRESLAIFQEYVNNVEINTSNTKASLNIADDPNVWKSITAEIINKFVKWLIAQGFAISTVNLRISFIKKYATIAFQAGTLPEDEWKRISGIRNYYGGKANKINVERTKQNIPTRRVGHKTSQELIEITDQQAQDLKSFSEDSPDGRRANLIMCLLLDQGLQPRDVYKLQAEHFDLVSSVFTLERSNMERQTLKLTPDSLRALKCVFDNHDIDTIGPLGFRIRRNGETIQTIQQSIRPPALRYHVHNVGKSIGIGNLTAQHCRFYWAKKAIESGTNVFDLQTTGGWINIQSVMQIVKKVKNS